MKVSDLLDDLEKGDRSKEHLNANEQPRLPPGWQVNLLRRSLRDIGNMQQAINSSWQSGLQQSQAAQQLYGGIASQGQNILGIQGIII